MSPDPPPAGQNKRTSSYSIMATLAIVGDRYPRQGGGQGHLRKGRDVTSVSSIFAN
jgi:hypothetical protein